MDPYFDQDSLIKKRRKIRIRVYFSAAALFLAFIALVYILVFSPIFKVDGFTVTGNHRVSAETALALLKPQVVRGTISSFFSWNNFLAWQRGEIDLTGTALAGATIKKDWLKRSINITVRERERLGIWCIEGENCYWLDNNGIVFEEAPVTEGSLILKVYDLQKSDLRLGFPVIEERFINNLTGILKNLSQLAVAIKKISLDRKLQELRVETYDGADILFSIRFDPMPNIESFQKLSETLDLRQIDYVDLRIDNRIYYKN